MTSEVKGEIEMVNVNVSKVINRPVADVFSFVANFENHPKWETDFLEVKQILTTPNGIGTTYQCRLQFPGQTVSSKFVITEYELNHKIAFLGEPAGPATPRGSYLFEATEGGTKITSQPRPEFRGFFRLLEPMLVGYIRKNNVDHLNNLKRLLKGEF
jgi:uncharacterized membrane protein